MPSENPIESAIRKGLGRIGRTLDDLSGGNFVKHMISNRHWVQFYTDFLGNVEHIFGEYTWADGAEHYIVYTDREGRIREYDGVDGRSYLISEHADPKEIEDALADREHKDLATKAIVPPRNCDMPTEPFESQPGPAVFCDVDM
jgi:hypothetical protein